MSGPAPPLPAMDHPTLQQLDELEALIERMLALPVYQAEMFTADGERAETSPAPAEKPAYAPTLPSPKVGGGKGAGRTAGAGLAGSSEAVMGSSMGGAGEAAPTEKGVGHLLPERPEGCFAQKVPDPEIAADSWGGRGSCRAGSAGASPSRRREGADEPPIEQGAELASGWALPQLSAGVGSNTPTLPSPSLGEGRVRVDRGQMLLHSRWRPLLWSNDAFDRCLAHLGRPGAWLRGPRGRTTLGWTGLALLAAALVWGFLDWIGWTW